MGFSDFLGLDLFFLLVLFIMVLELSQAAITKGITDCKEKQIRL